MVLSVLQRWIMFPEFENDKREVAYWKLFDEQVCQYMIALYKVKEEMYGKGTGNFSNLPGTCTEHVVKITNNLIHTTNTTFENNGTI